MQNTNSPRAGTGPGEMVLPNNAGNVSGNKSALASTSPSSGVSIRLSQAICRYAQAAIRFCGNSATTTPLPISAKSCLKSAFTKAAGRNLRDSPPLACPSRNHLQFSSLLSPKGQEVVSRGERTQTHTDAFEDDKSLHNSVLQALVLRQETLRVVLGCSGCCAAVRKLVKLIFQT